MFKRKNFTLVIMLYQLKTNNKLIKVFLTLKVLKI